MANTRKNKKGEASASKKPSPVTPTKDAKGDVKEKKYSLIILNNGRHLPFKSLVWASKYEKANATAISAVHRFHTEEDMGTFQAKMASEKKPSAKRVNDSILSPEQKESLARMKRIKTTRHPHKAITLHYKTTPFSQACVVLLDVVDYNGNTQWNFKAVDHKENLQAYVDCGEEISGTHTEAMIRNLKLAERRNLEKKDQDAPLKNKGWYNICKMMAYFVLPENDATVNSEETEKDYIERELQAFATELKNILTSPLYNAAMKDHVGSYSDKFLDTLYSPKKGPTLPDFIQSCSILVQPIKSIGEHIIKARESDFEDILHQYDNPIPKFISDEEALQAANVTDYSPNFHPTGGPDMQDSEGVEIDGENLNDDSPETED